MRLIAVLLPYAVSIRDFVHTGTLSGLLSIPDVTIDIYTQNGDLPELDAIRSARVRVKEIAPHTSGRIEAVLKKLYLYLFHDVFVHVQHGVEAVPGRRLPVQLLVLARKLAGTRRALRFYAWLLMRVSARARTNQIDGTPDLVISTRSLINSLDYGIVLEASKRGLRQLTAAASWDNFTTKGFFPFPVAKTIVWNRKMAEELEELFEVEPDKIVIAGYPRVRLLRNTGTFGDAETYLRSLGLDRYRRFILHTVSYSELTRNAPGETPVEYVMAREVATALVERLPADTCILVRLHPFSDTRDEAAFDGVDRLHVFVPGRQDRYVERVMSEADEVHLACQLTYSECVVSMASTITIDALSIGQPIINVAFEPSGAPPSSKALRRFYEYNHLRDLLAAVTPPMATDIDQVIAFVERCMAGNKELGANMEAFERLYVPDDSDDYPSVVKATVEELLAS